MVFLKSVGGDEDNLIVLSILGKCKDVNGIKINNIEVFKVFFF